MKKNITTEGNIRWTRGELIFLLLVGLAMMSLVIFSIIRDVGHP